MLPSMRQSGVAGVANLTVGFDGEAQIEHRGWLRLRSTKWRAHYAIDGKALPERMEITFASFVGIAVHRSAVERIGLPKPELFIKGDDLEYCVRLAALGPIILVPGSKIIHKEGQNSNYHPIRRFGMQSMRLPLDRLWLTYFPLRNLVWIRRHHCGSGLAAGFAARVFLRIVFGILVFDSNHRWVRLKFYWNAITDAWGGTFDNDKPRRLTGVLPPTIKRQPAS
jgi:GT2 family glycosyltransferase